MRSCPEIGSNDVGIGLNFRGCSKRKPAAKIHAQHAIRNGRHKRHVMLNHDNRDAEIAPDILDPEREIARFLTVEA
jgi:hypothetical protein